MYSSGGMCKANRNRSAKSLHWVSAEPAPSPSAERPRNSSSLESIARSTSSKQLPPSHSRNRAKSGSGPSLLENVIHFEQTTIDNRRYALDKWVYRFFEGRFLADTNNRAMKELVEKWRRSSPRRQSAII
jgi:hypothetical protein